MRRDYARGAPGTNYPRFTPHFFVIGRGVGGSGDPTGKLRGRSYKMKGSHATARPHPSFSPSLHRRYVVCTSRPHRSPRRRPLKLLVLNDLLGFGPIDVSIVLGRLPARSPIDKFSVHPHTVRIHGAFFVPPPSRCFHCRRRWIFFYTPSSPTSTRSPSSRAPAADHHFTQILDHARRHRCNPCRSLRRRP
jgi:hypothetical protein